MPRSSRHKSHRERKRDARSDSEEEGNSRERRPRGEEPAGGGGSAVGVSKGPEPERKRSSAKDVMAVDNSDEHGRKRKERAEDVVSAPADRWNGGEGDDRSGEKRSKAEEFAPVDAEKCSKSKQSASDLKSKSSRRHEGSGEKNEENVGKVEPMKQRSEKDLSRRESSSSQYKDTKKRDRERGSDEDKKVQDTRHEKPDDGTSKKERSKRGDVERKKEGESAEWQIQDELRNLELEKELDKRMKKRREGSGDKWLSDGRDGDDKRLSSRDDRSKGGSYNDGRQKDGAYRDKYREDLDEDQRHRDDRSSKDDKDQRHRDERISSNDRDQRHLDDRSSRDERDQRHRDNRASRDDRDQRHRDDKYRDDHSPSDSKYFREEKKPSESRYRKGRYHDSDRDGGQFVDDHVRKYKDDRGRRRFSDENDDHSDLKLGSAKESREDVEKTASSTSRFDSCADRPRPDYLRLDKVDPNLTNNQQGGSPSSSAYVKDQSRVGSKQVDSTHRGSPSAERFNLSTTSTGDRVSGVRERASEYRSLVKAKSKDDIHSCELLVGATGSQYDRTPRSDAYTSPNKLTEKSPSTSERRLPDRTDSRRSLDVEEVGQRGSSKDVRDLLTIEEPLEKPIADDQPQVELPSSEGAPMGSSFFNRTSHFSSSSPSHLPLPFPVRLGIDGPSVLGSYEDDRGHSGDRKSNGRYRRTGDFNMGRGQGSAWKGAPTWPSPVSNGFIPLQHGPPTGFHPNVQQFPAPPLFSVRPSMDFNHTGLPFHVHEAADRFSGHGHPFGWRNPVDDSCSPHLPVWDGSNGMFGDESHAYGRPDWDQNRPPIGSRGWEMSPDLWRGQNGNVNMELPVPQKEPEYVAHALSDETWGGSSGHRLRHERVRMERLPAESSSSRRPNETPLPKNAIEPPPKGLHEKTTGPIKTASTPEFSKTSTDDNALISCAYLSRLDISCDLAQPELYQKCVSLLGTRDVTDVCAVSKRECPQDNKEEIKVGTNSPNRVISNLFPVTSDSVFQRAISLYKKNVGSKLKAPASPIVCLKDEKGSLQASDKKKVMAVDNHTPDDASLANAEEGSIAATDSENGLPGDAKEQSSDLVSDAVVFVEGSESCEALIPECRVNLSRIPISPESTH